MCILLTYLVTYCLNIVSISDRNRKSDIKASLLCLYHPEVGVVDKVDQVCQFEVRFNTCQSDTVPDVPFRKIYRPDGFGEFE